MCKKEWSQLQILCVFCMVLPIIVSVLYLAVIALSHWHACIEKRVANVHTAITMPMSAAQAGLTFCRWTLVLI